MWFREDGSVCLPNDCQTNLRGVDKTGFSFIRFFIPKPFFWRPSSIWPNFNRSDVFFTKFLVSFLFFNRLGKDNSKPFSPPLVSRFSLLSSFVGTQVNECNFFMPKIGLSCIFVIIGEGETMNNSSLSKNSSMLAYLTGKMLISIVAGNSWDFALLFDRKRRLCLGLEIFLIVDWFFGGWGKFWREEDWKFLGETWIGNSSGREENMN